MNDKIKNIKFTKKEIINKINNYNGIFQIVVDTEKEYNEYFLSSTYDFGEVIAIVINKSSITIDDAFNGDITFQILAEVELKKVNLMKDLDVEKIVVCNKCWDKLIELNKDNAIKKTYKKLRALELSNQGGISKFKLFCECGSVVDLEV